MNFGSKKIFYGVLVVILSACTARNNIDSQAPAAQTLRHVPGGCENCELMFDGIPKEMNAIDTSDGWSEPGQKLIVKGKVFQVDQSTPASDIILYYYHTDQKGYYSPGDNKDAASNRHGRLRGWVKTGTDGTYAIYTSRPAQYPGNQFEAHIHVIVKEPDIEEPYWIDEWIFDDDPLVTTSLRQRLENRGGSGILKTTLDGDVQVANHDVFLGRNIPGYPVKSEK